MFTCITTGSSQCFTRADCRGDQVPAGNQRECCIETNTGLSYNDGGTCTECINIGIAIYIERYFNCTYCMYMHAHMKSFTYMFVMACHYLKSDNSILYGRGCGLGLGGICRH